ncbi:MAG: hypothetical protein ACREL3_08275 [Gemmatimonadales bacterium]
MSAGRKICALLAVWVLAGCGGQAGSTAPVSPKRSPANAPADQATIPFVLDPDGRIALATLERLNMITTCEEASPGLLRLRLGSGWNRPAAEYHLSHLYNAYAPHIEGGQMVALELWQGNSKIGEYTVDGLLIGPEFSKPR